MSKLKLWISETKGATAIEYGLIACGVCVVIAGSVFAFGEVIAGFYDQIYDAVFG